MCLRTYHSDESDVNLFPCLIIKALLTTQKMYLMFVRRRKPFTCRPVVEVNAMIFKNVMLTYKDVEHWINIPIEGSSGKSSSYEYEDYEESDSIVVWETAVQPLTDVQRLIFFSITILVASVAVVGNFLVLYVNFSR